MSGGGTRYDLIVPDDEVFRVKRTWVQLSDDNPMPFEARYAAWGAWVVAMVLTLVVEFSLGLMALGWFSFLIVLASVVIVTLAVVAVFLFGVDFEKPMVTVLAQLVRGSRLQIEGLLPSQAPRSTALMLRATARQERPARRRWFRRTPPASPTQEGAVVIYDRVPVPARAACPRTKTTKVAKTKVAKKTRTRSQRTGLRRALQFVRRLPGSVGKVIADEPVLIVVGVFTFAFIVLPLWSGRG